MGAEARVRPLLNLGRITFGQNGFDKSQKMLLRMLADNQAWLLYRKALWKQYHEVLSDAQNSQDPARKLALLSKASGIKSALDLWKDVLAKDESAEHEAEESS